MDSGLRPLAVIETHPVQYHAPVYRRIQQQFGIPVNVLYGSDFSVAGYLDAEFGRSFAWDTDLLSGYTPIFLSRVASGGARSAPEASARGVRGQLRYMHPHAVLLVGYSPRFYWEALWYTRLARYPVLFRGETTDHAVVRGPIKRRLRDRFLRSLYGQCSALLYVGQRSLEHYVRLGVNRTRLVFSPYCVDLSAFEPDEAARDSLRSDTRADLGVSDRHFAVLFSGKLVERKAPDMILLAIKALPADLRERMVAIFLGDGVWRDRLHRLAAADPPVMTRFVGFQPQRMLSRFYHAADALVLPSRMAETWGLVVNEALSHGLPCVVSDQVGCAPDLVRPGETGEIFTAGSSRELASALTRVMRLAGRTIRDQCRSRVADYSLDSAAEGIAKAYWIVARSRSML